jgi:hypothetical protein
MLMRPQLQHLRPYTLAVRGPLGEISLRLIRTEISKSFRFSGMVV